MTIGKAIAKRIDEYIFARGDYALQACQGCRLAHRDFTKFIPWAHEKPHDCGGV